MSFYFIVTVVVSQLLCSKSCLDLRLKKKKKYSNIIETKYDVVNCTYITTHNIYVVRC